MNATCKHNNMNSMSSKLLSPQPNIVVTRARDYAILLHCNLLMIHYVLMHSSADITVYNKRVLFS